jgi:hypothetical protein
VPIPVFYHRQTDEPLLDEEVHRDHGSLRIPARLSYDLGEVDL